MPCHVSSQCVQYCCRSKRRHKHRPVSIGLSVSRRDFIRNLSTGISIRNQGSSRICAEIFAATFAVDFLSRGRNRQMWISAHTASIWQVLHWKYTGKYCTGNTLGSTAQEIHWFSRHCSAWCWWRRRASIWESE